MSNITETPVSAPLKAFESQHPAVMDSSPELGKLFEALSKAQAEMEPAVMDSKNPHYNSKFASLKSCRDSYQGPLGKYGLSLIQQVFSNEQGYFIRTTLGHSSGQWISNTFKLMVGKQDMQGLGSAITYARRYSLSALTGVAADEDDDAESAVAQKVQDQPKPIAPKVQSQASAVGSQTPLSPSQGSGIKTGELTAPQLARLFAIANANKWTNEQIKLFMQAQWGIESTKDLKKDQYESLVGTIEAMSFEKACISQVKK